tara:strand:- start:82 stop:294 length:213 start_codon:yes stop_codon:yes gene_type:complete
MKVGDEVEVKTGKLKGCFGILKKSFTVKKVFSGTGQFYKQKKWTVFFEEIDKTANYNHDNLRLARKAGDK